MPLTPDGNWLEEDARILFRNFEGREEKYNKEGKRNFCLVLSDQDGQRLLDEGWNVKTLRAKDPDDPDRPYLQIEVSYKFRPPKVVLITSRGRTDIPEELLKMLDVADIKKVDLIARPYPWNVNGNSGIKAYLKTIFVTLAEDYLEEKYADVREIGPVDEIDYIDAEVVEEVPAITSGRKAIGSGR